MTDTPDRHAWKATARLQPFPDRRSEYRVVDGKTIAVVVMPSGAVYATKHSGQWVRLIEEER